MIVLAVTFGRSLPSSFIIVKIQVWDLAWDYCGPPHGVLLEATDLVVATRVEAKGCVSLDGPWWPEKGRWSRIYLAQFLASWSNIAWLILVETLLCLLTWARMKFVASRVASFRNIWSRDRCITRVCWIPLINGLTQRGSL